MMPMSNLVLWNSAIRWVFPMHNNPKKVDLSYKTGLDFLGCFGGENLCLNTEEVW